MDRGITLKLAVALACLTVPVVAALADIQDPNIFVPESSMNLPGDLGIQAHTNHLIYIGPPDFRGQEIDPVELAPHGPTAFGFLTSPSGYHPADIRGAYKLGSIGGANAIAIVDAFHYATSLNDFNVFAGQYGLPKETSSDPMASTNAVFQVVYQGTSKPAANASWGQEMALDIEWAHAMAPGAKIYLVEANSAKFADLFAAVQKAAGLPGVKQVSMSWGGSEFKGETTNDSGFAAQGVTYFAAAGDMAAEKSYPAMSVNVVSVGGTTLKLSSNGAVTSETVWKSTGGGLSTYEAIPTYQKAIANLVGKKRGGPDISLVADPNTGVSVFDSTKAGGYVGWLVIGGTSVATPCIAGIANFSNHSYASGVDELAHIYSGLGTSSFRDITTGSAGVDKAKNGWDFCTGVGSPLGTDAL